MIGDNIGDHGWGALFSYGTYGGWPAFVAFDNSELALLLDVVEAVVSIHPETLNLRAQGMWITAYIELPDPYVVEDIDIGTVQFVYGNEVVTADWGEVQNGVLMVKFDRAAVAEILEVGDAVEVSIVGEVGEMPFEGTTTIRVIDPAPPARGRP